MKTSDLTLPEIGLIAATRGLLGAGIGLLIADHISPRRRNRVGGTLLAIGVVSTLPLVAGVFSKLHDNGGQ